MSFGFQTKNNLTALVIIIQVIFSLNVYLLNLKLTPNHHTKPISTYLEDLNTRAQVSHRNVFVWQVDGDTSSIFESNGSKEWKEVSNSKIFTFTEQPYNGETKEVLLYDDTRKFSILLNPKEAKLKSGESKEFTRLYSGFWKVFNGQTSFPITDKPDDFMDLFANPKKLSPIKPKIGAQPKIHVLLASYRDKLCGNSLYEMFKYAKNPENVYASVAQQNDAGDEGCLEAYCKIDQTCRRSQVHIVEIDLEHSRGVMPARYRQLEGLNSSHTNDFCLQIDSHSAFETNWDTLAIDDFKATKNEYAVLTTYPNRVKDKHNQKLSPARCSTKFSDHKVDGVPLKVVNGGNSAHNVPPKSSPMLVPFFGAGIAFSKCHANFNVPYDPYMSYLFGGEEFNRASRLFTWGYDMYAPRKNFVYHYYDDDIKEMVKEDKQKKNLRRDRSFFSDKEGLGQETTLRWRHVLGLDNQGKFPKKTTMTDMSLFGFGVKRSLATYLRFAGVDFNAGIVTSRCKELGKMKWIPYASSVIEQKIAEIGLPECNSLELSRYRSRHFLSLSNVEVSSLIKSEDKDETVADDGGVLNDLAVQIARISKTMSTAKYPSSEDLEVAIRENMRRICQELHDSRIDDI